MISTGSSGASGQGLGQSSELADISMSVNWAKLNFALWNCQDCSGSNQSGVFVEAFIVPTRSMEPVIIRGDRILVSKIHERPGRRGAAPLSPI